MTSRRIPMNKDEVLNISQDRKTKKRKAERQKDRTTDI